ncbi:MAG: flagellar hook-associated protein FlgK [Alphaproteobacteria bacterium]|nr:MAG: flagellar hook-associated protein FlgK [Alphaproteobacteria bacterium]
MATLSLDSALSGLKAAQRSLDTISNNIANAQTVGYTRKILPQETLVVGGVGMGVTLDAIMRNVDKALLRDLFKQLSVSQSAAVTQTYLNRIQDFNGAAEAEKSISAMLGKLADAFSSLSGAPDNSVALQQTLTAAQQVAKTFNNYNTLLNQMRSDTEGQVSQDVVQANAQIRAIATLNLKIQGLTASGQSTADLEDQRDIAIRNLSKFMQISTFSGENNILVVMTKQGQTLADTTAHQLVFEPSPLTASTYYPGGGANGLFIDSTGGAEITQGQIGGEIGALFELRDDTIPTYQAQIDELAQKTAYRFQQEGLKLFTDANGSVPVNVADPGIVGYVGFAGQIRVNQNVVADPTLIRRGTNGGIVASGSNEIIRKISQFAFGAYEYQQANGTADISAGTLFSSLSLTQVNKINGDQDLTDYTPDLDAAPNITAPAQFSIDIGGGPVVITINPGDTATDLVNNINTALGSSVASLSGGGQLVLTAGADITLADIDIGAAGMADLGFSFGAFAAQDPSFTVQVGTQSPVTVNISATDTATDLLNTLNAIPGLIATLGTGGELILTPRYGGDITLANVTGTPLAALGMTVANVAHAAFRQNNLGPGGALSTGLSAGGSLEDFARGAISAQAEDASRAADSASREDTYFQALDKRNSDASGVSIDEEIAGLTRVQSAYAAAARMISATEKMLDDLLNSV